MIQINPRDISPIRLQHYLLEGVAPRPVALASTVDANGRPNLSPFSFYNAFSVNPPLLIFSPARRGRDNATKDTYQNIKEVPEVAIHAVNRAITEQVSLASTEYPKGVSEFEKAGLTPIPSVLVKPPRVKESPLHFECRVKQVIETGPDGGAGNLVICDILMIHVDESILSSDGHIDQNLIDLVGRLGGDYYVRASGDALFTVPKPLTTIGIGVDSLPPQVRHSPVLTGRHLGILGNLERTPDTGEIGDAFEEMKKAFNNPLPSLTETHTYAARLIDAGDYQKALAVLFHP